MTPVDSSLSFRPCLLIPCYNHGPALVRMLEGWLAARGSEPLNDETLLPCLIIDDGSQPETVQLLNELAARYHWITLVRLPLNQGKGGAGKKNTTECLAKHDFLQWPASAGAVMTVKRALPARGESRLTSPVQDLSARWGSVQMPLSIMRVN